jgi:N-formylglutamate amidohydrolase
VPDDIKNLFVSKYQNNYPDTDFDVDKLYDFAPEVGAHFITAEFNRYVVDLNRDPKSKPLYDDGRILTGLFPEQSFEGDSIYKSPIDPKSSMKRLQTYYTPYHEKIADIIKDLKSRHRSMLLFECHSILRDVPKIHKGDLPDLMIGTDDGKTLPLEILEKMQSFFEKRGFKTALNSPFKGGFITRHYADPKNNIYSVQLEMSKDLYLGENNKIDVHRSSKIKTALKELTKILATQIENR